MNFFTENFKAIDNEFKTIKQIFYKKISNDLELVSKEDFNIYVKLIDKMIDKAEKIEGKLHKQSK